MTAEDLFSSALSEGSVSDDLRFPDTLSASERRGMGEPSARTEATLALKTGLDFAPTMRIRVHAFVEFCQQLGLRAEPQLWAQMLVHRRLGKSPNED